jgi:hypothetical protein
LRSLGVWERRDDHHVLKQIGSLSLIAVGLSLLVACSDDAAVDGDSPDSGVLPMAGTGTSGGAGGATATGGSGGTGSGSGGSGGAAGSTAGTGGTGGADLDDDGGVMADAGDEEPDETVTLPSDGEALSVCAASTDCTGDGLSCSIFGTQQGFCSAECDEDDDCDEIDGLESSCDNLGVCVVDCVGDGEGDGECPQHMECVPVQSLLTPTYRCQYPEPKDHDIYEVCDGLRGDADCMEGLTCQVLAGLPLLSDVTLPYCAAGCTEAADCDDQGSDATPVCDQTSLFVLEGLCALECAEDDDCPGDMECFSMDLLENRCGYAP